MSENRIDLGDDELGYVTVVLKGVEQTLDLWATNNDLCDLFEAHKDKTASEWHNAVVDFLVSRGFPTVSHRAASCFVDAIFGRVRDLKNAAGASGKQDSPAPTAPQS